MEHQRTRTGRAIALLVAALAMLALASCSSDSKSDGDSTTTMTATDSGGSGDNGGGESAATVAFDKTIQQELADVGCYEGTVDGILGPESDAAIVAFQTASGLTPDGELGPETEAALTKAVDEGTKVCDGSTPAGTTTTSTTPSGGGSAACTATAVAAALPSGTEVSSYVCSDGYAAGTTSDEGTFILQDEGGAWKDLGTEPCGTASAGLPPVILETGCPA